jgi:hypothetical protein
MTEEHIQIADQTIDTMLAILSDMPVNTTLLTVTGVVSSVITGLSTQDPEYAKEFADMLVGMIQNIMEVPRGATFQ